MARSDIVILRSAPAEGELDGNKLFMQENYGEWKVRCGPLVPEALRVSVGCNFEANLRRGISKASQPWIAVSFNDIDDKTVSFTCATKDLQEILNRLETGCQSGRIKDRLVVIDVEGAA